MSFHLVVTRPFGAYSTSAIITDPAEVEAVSAGPFHRNVVRVYEGATHASEVVETAAPAAAVAEPPAPEPAKIEPAKAEPAKPAADKRA